MVHDFGIHFTIELLRAPDTQNQCTICHLYASTSWFSSMSLKYPGCLFLYNHSTFCWSCTLHSINCFNCAAPGRRNRRSGSAGLNTVHHVQIFYKASSTRVLKRWNWIRMIMSLNLTYFQWMGFDWKFKNQSINPNFRGSGPTRPVGPLVWTPEILKVTSLNRVNPWTFNKCFRLNLAVMWGMINNDWWWIMRDDKWCGMIKNEAW